jgi:DNA-binding PadR family transcriptional regulator
LLFVGAAKAKTSDVSKMRSVVNWTVLGLVIDRPSYGYELAQRFERVYEDVLPISSVSHVYTALDMLEAKGLIEETPGKGAPRARSGRRRQPKVHYRETSAGVRYYEEWLLAQTRDSQRRSQLFVRQLAVYDPDGALRVLERYEQECLREAARLSVDPGGGSPGEPLLVARLAHEESRLAVEARLAWIEYARRELKALALGRTPR